MKDLIIYGAGGLASETTELIEDINMIKPTWRIKGFIDDIKGNNGETLGGYPILGTREILKSVGHPVWLVLAMSNPSAKEEVFGALREHDLEFATLIHPSARIARSATVGEGTIIGAGCIVSTNAAIGKHVFLNMQTVVGHDAIIKDFSSCLVNTIISGNAVVNESVFLGSSSIVMEKKVIGKNAKVSMGSIVSFDVEDGAVVMTRPSKSMKF